MVTTGHAGESRRLQERFDTAIKEYGSMISGICLSYASDRDAFEDIRQDTYINIWRGLRSYRGDAKMSTWIYRVTINTCISSTRRRSPFGNRNDSLEEIPDIADIPNEELERVEYLHSLIRQLSYSDRAIVLMWLDVSLYLGVLVDVSFCSQS